MDRNCRQARRFAAGLREAGQEILNDVVLNQVLVAFGDDRDTMDVIRGVQHDGTCWCGATRWGGRAVMRISVSSWATRDDDVERSLTAILRVADNVHGQGRVGEGAPADSAPAQAHHRRRRGIRGWPR